MGDGRRDILGWIAIVISLAAFVERAIRPIALTRKNALFAGSDGGARSWAVIASLIQTAKLNDVEPFAYLRDVLERLVAGHPVNRIDDLLPWNYAASTASSTR